ncbi:FHA domain-containing protein [Nocardioides sp. R-C-SC26]|uniref:FHA domain-containing protein n=1 Tax=Nocardioides sp. R-C-SC26 TaxID=2870414 RepID=UPI001E52AE39|nr:FHA domain-containing protein [Nocardioides sp. R-C-SC26]
MSTIVIQSPTQTWTADSPRAFRIGREETCDIVVPDPTVSRQHAEIRAVGEGWEVVDLGSSLGTWVNGHRLPGAALVGTTTIGLGDQGRGFTLTVTVTPSAHGAPPTSGGQPFAPPASAPPGPAAPTSAPHPGPAVPAAPGYQPPMQTTVLAGSAPTAPGGIPPVGAPSGPGLLIRRRLDTDLRFAAGTLVRIGRDPGFEVVADDTAVSRQHAVVEPRPDGWWFVDHSTGGSYVDGERITALQIDEPVEISLGHPTAGYEIEVVPVVAAGEASAAIVRKKRLRSAALVGGVVGVLALVGGGIAAATLIGGDDDEPGSAATQVAGLSEAELDRAKAATVLLTAVDETGSAMWTGSGSVISEDGRILTNAHVGDPNAPGQGSEYPDPAYLTVSFTSGSDDAPAAARYRAHPIVSDGYLDIAVLQIDADIDGGEVDTDELELPEPLPIGDSDDLRTGDRIVALGYPSIGNVAADGDRPLTVTEGVVSTFQADPIVGTERGAIDSDVRLGSGNSGGPSINDDGEIIGLNTRVITAQSQDAGAITQGSALIVPVNLAEAVLDIADDGGDPSYVSPYVDEVPSVPEGQVGGAVTSAGWVPSGTEGECAGSSSLDEPMILANVAPGQTVSAEFVVEGVPDGVTLTVDFYTLDGQTRIDSLSDTWSSGPDATCIWASFAIADSIEGLIAAVSLGGVAEPVAQNPVLFQ